MSLESPKNWLQITIIAECVEVGGVGGGVGAPVGGGGEAAVGEEDTDGNIAILLAVGIILGILFLGILLLICCKMCCVRECCYILLFTA